MIDFDRLNFDPCRQYEQKLCSFTTVKKSILKLVKLQILVPKSSRYEKYFCLKCSRLCMPTFPVRNTNIIKKMVNFAWLYIFRILQHFAAEFCNFTNFRMLFLFLDMSIQFLDMSIVNIVLADQAAFPTLWIT